MTKRIDPRIVAAKREIRVFEAIVRAMEKLSPAGRRFIAGRLLHNELREELREEYARLRFGRTSRAGVPSFGTGNGGDMTEAEGTQGEPLLCRCGHPLDVHGPSPRTGKLCCFELASPGVSCQCNDYSYAGSDE